MEKESTETIVPQGWKPEAEKVAEFVEALDDAGKEQLLSFISGARFALSLTRKTAV